MRRITSRFGEIRRDGSLHRGVDVAVPVGTELRAPVRAFVDSVWTEEDGGMCVRLALPSASGGWAGDNTMGDDTGALITYAHLSAALVRAGDTVEAGKVVALSGNSGEASTGPHAHIAVELFVDVKWSFDWKGGASSKEGRTWIDPVPFFGGSAVLEGRTTRRQPLPRRIRAAHQAEKGGAVRAITITGSGNAISIGGNAVGVNLQTALSLLPGGSGSGGYDGPPLRGASKVPPSPSGIGGFHFSGPQMSQLPMPGNGGQFPRLPELGGVAQQLATFITPENVNSAVQGLTMAGQVVGGVLALGGTIASAAAPAASGVPYLGPALAIGGPIATIAGTVIGAASGLPGLAMAGLPGITGAVQGLTSAGRPPLPNVTPLLPMGEPPTANKTGAALAPIELPLLAAGATP